MNQEETLALWKKGKEAWNAWAEKMLADRKALKDKGEWNVTVKPWGEEEPKDEITTKWFKDAYAVFSSTETPHVFPEATSFNGWLFPSESEWAAATFEGDAEFNSAAFEGVAGFISATFKGVARFNSAAFEGDAWFESAAFKGGAEFDSATFKRVARFNSAAFEGIAGFNSATFKGVARFNSAAFEGDAWFNSAAFESDAVFNSAAFKRVAVFNSAAFKRVADFESAAFKGVADFESAAFEGVARFESATFEGYAGFESVCFEKPTRFSGARFNTDASFNSAQIKQAFDLSGARFKEVPDFRQTHCDEAPLLDDVHIDNTLITHWKSSHEPDFTVTANYRALKRLAIQGHDHKHEVEFFAEELRAQRIMIHKRFGWDWWLSAMFAATSDYGRSILRPMVWWLPVTLFSALSYLLSAIPTKAPKSLGDAIYQSVVSWYHGIQLVIPTRFHISWLPEATEFQQAMCQGGSVVAAAYNLAASKGLIIPGIADRTLITQAYKCLYDGDVPFGISWIMGLQTLLSAALLFLLLLGIRNRFKLK